MSTFTNWAGNFEYSATAVHYATSMAGLPGWVQRQDRFKVLGTRHCFNDIADSPDGFLSVAGLHSVIRLDTAGGTVTVEAGIRYGELAEWLNDRGYALHNLASLPHISVAGGCATATHGSGMRNGNLSSALVGMEFVTSAGETIRLTRQQDGDLFHGAVVHLGGIGVITKLTLAVEPAYTMRQFVFERLPVAGLEQHFDEIMSAGYSVSLFTGWRDKTIDSVWIKVRQGEDARFAEGASFFGARAASVDVHPILDLPAENCTPQLGVPGPWHERLPHFKMGFMPSSGEELQSEYFVPREYSVAAVMAVEALHIHLSPYLLISEVRSIAEDDAWMSPCSEGPVTAIHFTWKPDLAAVKRLLPLIEQALEPFGARPHWGKLFTTPHSRLLELYPKMREFQQLLRQYDPEGKFRNAYLDRVIFGN